MNKKLSIYSNSLFVAYLIIGGSYIVFSFLLLYRSFPGFFMQILLLADSVVRNPESLTGLLSSSTFVTSVIVGLVAIVLVSYLFAGVIRSIKQIKRSHGFVKNIKVYKNINRINILKDCLPASQAGKYNVFTAGLFTPKVYISKRLYESLSKKQLEAVLVHENSHVKSHDPLKGFLVQFVNNIFPIFPYKKNFVELYSTMVELKSDFSAEEKIKDRKPLIEALRTILSFNNSSNLDPAIIKSYIDKPERIPILVGLQNFRYKIVFFVVTMFIALAVVLPVSAYATNFYNCEHLIDCIKIFMNSVEQSGASSDQDLCSMHADLEALSCGVK